MKFRRKTPVVEAITFAELVAHGLAQSGANIVNGMPWSFDYAGHPITHENDDCYVIPTTCGTAHLTKDDMLVTDVDGTLFVLRKYIFENAYERAE